MSDTNKKWAPELGLGFDILFEFICYLTHYVLLFNACQILQQQQQQYHHHQQQPPLPSLRPVRPCHHRLVGLHAKAVQKLVRHMHDSGYTVGLTVIDH